MLGMQSDCPDSDNLVVAAAARTRPAKTWLQIRAASSKEIPNPNTQTDHAGYLKFGYWSFPGAWMLEFGFLR
jgi:hypothetical protein